MDDNINGVSQDALSVEENTAAGEPEVAEGDGGEPKKPLRLDYAQTFKVTVSTPPCPRSEELWEMSEPLDISATDGSDVA